MSRFWERQRERWQEAGALHSLLVFSVSLSLLSFHLFVAVCTLRLIFFALLSPLPIFQSQCATKCQTIHSGCLLWKVDRQSPSFHLVAQLGHLISIFSLWWEMEGNCPDCQNNCTQISAHMHWLVHGHKPCTLEKAVAYIYRPQGQWDTETHISIHECLNPRVQGGKKSWMDKMEVTQIWCRFRRGDEKNSSFLLGSETH